MKTKMCGHLLPPLQLQLIILHLKIGKIPSVATVENISQHRNFNTTEKFAMT